MNGLSWEYLMAPIISIRVTLQVINQELDGITAGLHLRTFLLAVSFTMRQTSETLLNL